MGKGKKPLESCGLGSRGSIKRASRGPIVQPLTMRYFFRFELEHLLARSGFELAALYGGFDGSAFADSSPEMIFLATRAQEA